MREKPAGKPKVPAAQETRRKPTSRPTEPPKNTYYGAPKERYHEGKGTQDYVSPQRYRERQRNAVRQKDTMWIEARKTASGRRIPGYLAYRNGPKKGQKVSGSVIIEQPGTTYARRRVQSGPGNTNHRTNYTEAVYVYGRNQSPGAKAAREKAKDQRVQKTLDSKSRVQRAAARAKRKAK